MKLAIREVELRAPRSVAVDRVALVEALREVLRTEPDLAWPARLHVLRLEARPVPGGLDWSAALRRALRHRLGAKEGSA